MTTVSCVTWRGLTGHWTAVVGIHTPAAIVLHQACARAIRSSRFALFSLKFRPSPSR